MTRYELQKIGEQLANEFISTGSDLTVGLEKVANEYGFNQHQIQRVAEFANVAAYTGMLEKTAGANYISFPIARPEKVMLQEKVAEDTATSDYDFSYVLQEDVRFWPEVEEKTVPVYNQHIPKVAEVDQKLNRLSDLQLEIHSGFSKLAALSKQYVLGGFATEQTLYTVIAPATNREKIASTLDISGTPSTDKVDSNSEYAKKVASLDRTLTTYSNLVDEVEKDLALLKEAHPRFIKAQEEHFNYLKQL